MKTLIRFLFTLLCAASFSLASVHAATITVNSTADPTESGKTTLRDALTAAANGDTINFSVTMPATITLTSGQLVVSSSVNVTGPGADQLSVNGNDASRVFVINSGLTVTISGLTISGGHTTGPIPANQGGGIFNSGTLTISNSTISNNVADGDGGGIRNSGSLTVSGSTLSGNTSTGGGAIHSGGPCLGYCD